MKKTASKKFDFKLHTEEELKQIASDLHDGKIFCDRQLGNEGRLLPSVFMPLALGALAGYSKKEISKLGMIYEYLEKAGPRSINGFPIFFSCQLLGRDETTKVFKYFDEYKQLKDKFLKKEEA